MNQALISTLRISNVLISKKLIAKAWRNLMDFFSGSSCLLLLLLSTSYSVNAVVPLDTSNTSNTRHVISPEQQQQLIAQLKIAQGIAAFIQKKHFSFLSNPIVSKGKLTVYQGNVLWHVEQPIVSKTAIIDNDIWQFDGTYQKMASHGSIASLIKAVFTGEVDENQWQLTFINDKCLQLSPKDPVLAQAIVSLDVCLSEQPQQRQVTINDRQNNTTEIEINLLRDTLSEEENSEFDINP